MGYGGPRTAFYVQSDWDVLTQTIRKEDNVRVRAIFDREEREADRLARLQREEDIARGLEEESARRKAEDQAMWQEIEKRRLEAAGPRKKLTPAEAAARERQKIRTAELAQPKERCPPELHNGLTYGMVMYPPPWHTDFPLGRCGRPYAPGKDRDPIVPPPKDLSRLPPWVGSYSSHYGSLSEPWGRYCEEERGRYYCSGGSPSRRTDAANGGERALLKESLAKMKALEEEAERRRAAGGAAAGAASAYVKEKHRNGGNEDGEVEGGHLGNETPSSVQSIFSHADSNGPIEATGAQHMMYSSSRSEVDTHLRKYGGAMTGKDVPYKPDVYVTDMSLAQLQDRIIRLQLGKRTDLVKTKLE